MRLLIMFAVVCAISSLNGMQKTLAEKKLQESVAEFNLAEKAERDKYYHSATRHYKKAAALGHAEANYKLGVGYYHSGIKWLKKAAEARYDFCSKANYELAHINFAQGLYYLEQADSHKHLGAHAKLKELRQVTGRLNQETLNSIYS